MAFGVLTSRTYSPKQCPLESLVNLAFLKPFMEPLSFRISNAQLGRASVHRTPEVGRFVQTDPGHSESLQFAKF